MLYVHAVQCSMTIYAQHNYFILWQISRAVHSRVKAVLIMEGEGLGLGICIRVNEFCCMESLYLIVYV